MADAHVHSELKSSLIWSTLYTSAYLNLHHYKRVLISDAALNSCVIIHNFSEMKCHDTQHSRVDLCEGKARCCLTMDNATKSGLALDNAVRNTHLTTEGRQEQHNLQFYSSVTWQFWNTTQMQKPAKLVHREQCLLCIYPQMLKNHTCQFPVRSIKT